MARRTRKGRRNRNANGASPLVSAPPYIKRQLSFFDPLEEEHLVRIDEQVDWMLENIGFAFRDDPELGARAMC